MPCINVHSFDFDGCIFNRAYAASCASKSCLIQANEAFISEISERIQKEKVDEVVFMVGSNRQSWETDVLNKIMNSTDSCFNALVELGAEFQRRDCKRHYRLDPYLLADTYGNKPLGENFVKALAEKKELLNGYSFSKYLFDKSKLTLLYAQMHKLASENPQAQIVYDFYDDRSDILNDLNYFFTNAPNLMPHNLKLRLHKYAGKEIQKVAEIKGKGKIDNNYQENIKLMVDCAGLKCPAALANNEHSILLLLAPHKKSSGLIHFIKKLLLPLFAPALTSFMKRRKVECLIKAEKVTAPSLAVISPSKEQKSEQPSVDNNTQKDPLLEQLESIGKQICTQLKTEMTNFIARKKIPFESMKADDKARYMVVSKLHDTVFKITDNLEKNASPEKGEALKELYKTTLTTAIKASLLDSKLDKYNELEKIGIRLLNLISFVFSPIKRLVTRTWFYSTQGKPKEAVQATLKIANKI